ncbi:MAG: GNAT family N-acetyltransferase [Firmicutes bacterium]|nr:GNAT family N-acetyltransferase [Bacillota bacterium]
MDWFFVHPAYQGRGIGHMLVAATVARCRPKASSIRLSGIANGFYEKGGFRPGDKWFMMRR